ncbi:MAG: MBL fold metallo-hydrolase [Firmicutes bacterium]|nr:MBL fold metallo-hydrolase [Bacillota bacterium]
MRYREIAVDEDITLFEGHEPGRALTFNTYWVADPQGAVLIHTGSRAAWPALASALGSRLESLRYVVVPHFEADECGAIGLVVDGRPVTVLAGPIAARQLTGFGLLEQVRTVRDGEWLSLGHHRLEFIGAPSEVHLGMGLIAYDHASRILFSSDFLGQMGLWAEEGEVSAGMEEMREHTMPCPDPFRGLAARLLSLDIQVVAPGHGSILRGRIRDQIRRYFGLTPRFD